MGKLDLRTLAAMALGGTQGPALVKGSAEKSRMFQRITDKSMPPTENKVTDDEARIIRDWIDGGAITAEAAQASLPSRGENTHWAFQPPVRPTVPKASVHGWEVNPIDAFVLARLEKANVKPPSQADKRTLLRGVYLNLIGLLPTLEEQRAFLNDESPVPIRKLLTVFWRAHSTVNDGPGTGSMWRATRSRMATNATAPSLMPGAIATM